MELKLEVKMSFAFSFMTHVLFGHNSILPNHEKGNLFWPTLEIYYFPPRPLYVCIIG